MSHARLFQKLNFLFNRSKKKFCRNNLLNSTNFILSTLLLFSILSQYKVYGQTPKLKFEHVSVEKGLSHTSVKCILQDHLGYLWIGTLKGLNRFDGYRFVHFLNIPGDSSSLSNNAVISMTEDDNGILWIATDGGGINRYDRITNSFRHFKNKPTDKQSISSNQYLQLAKGRNNKLWVGTFGEGVNCFDTRTFTAKRYTHDPKQSNSISSNYINCLFEDRFGFLWIGTEGNGLDRMEIASGRVDHFISIPSENSSISHNYIASVFEDTKGELWITTFGGGINKFDRKEQKFIRFLQNESNGNEIWSSTIDNQGNIWLGYWGSGLAKYSPNNAHFRLFEHDADDPASLSSNIITALYFDSNNILWIGTVGGGLNKLQFPKIHLFAKESKQSGGLQSSSVHAIYGSGDSILWIGTAAGLHKLKRKTGTIENIQYLKGSVASKVIALTGDKENNLWICDDKHNIVQYNTVSKSAKAYKFYNTSGLEVHFEFRKILIDKDENVIACGYGVPLCLKRKKDSQFTIWRHDRTDSNSIAYNMTTDIVQDADGSYWIGTFSCGLDNFDLNRKTFSHYKFPLSNPDFLSLNLVLSLYQDRNNNLWAGTFGGLLHFDKAKKTFTVYTKKDGLSDNSVYGILADKNNNLWLSTGNGITKFNPTTKATHVFGISSGIQNYSFNQGAFFSTENGELHFGGEGGLNSFFPDSLHNSKSPPKLAITGVKVFDETIEFAKHYFDGTPLELPYNKNFIEITFAAFDFSVPEENRYAYMLEGLESKWHAPSTENFVKYTNLSPGDYIFRLKGANSEGNWNNKGVLLKITILPPFWGTWWFKLLLFIIIAGLSVYFYARRITTLKKETAIQQKFSQQLIELQDEERKRIASELHDGLGQNLLIINNYAKMGLRVSSDSSVNSHLGQITDTVLESIEEVRNIAYNLHPYQLEDLGLKNTIESLIKKISDTTDLTFSLNIQEPAKALSPETEITIFRIIQECINNVMKHSSAKEMQIALSFSGSEAQLQISDDGCGMSSETLSAVLKKGTGFGLKGIRERVRHQKGQFSMVSKESEGTTVLVKLPI